MKWEFKLYVSLGFLILILLVIQAGLFREERKSYSEINSINSFTQLMLDIEFNVYLMEGKDQHILVEGPGNRMKNIQTTFNDGCVTVKENGKKLFSRILDAFETDAEEVNIYITIDNLSNLKMETRSMSPDVKYSADDIIGLTISNGNFLILETKGTKNCV